MKMRSPEELLADRLNAYIDGRPDGSGAHRANEAPIVDALRLSASSVEPAPEFVERLSARLRRASTRSPSWLARWMFATERIKRALTRGLTVRRGMAVIATAAALALAIVLPLDQGGDRAPLPRLVYAAEADPQAAPPNLLADAEVTLGTALPRAPSEMRVYQARAVPVPATPEEALAVARDFGLSDPRVYRAIDTEDALVVVGAHGQSLGLYQFAGARAIEYFDQLPGADTVSYGRKDRAAADGPPLSLKRAADLSVAFLREHEILPAAHPIHDAYHIHDLTEPAIAPSVMVQLSPELDGVPVFGGYFAWATVAPKEEVTRLTLHEPMAFEPGRVYPIKSAEQAYSELVSGQLTRGPFRLEIEGAHRIPAPRTPSTVYRPLPPDWSPGQPVTVTGWLSRKLVAEDGGDVRALLTTRAGTFYDLTGAQAGPLVTADGDDVEVRGTVVAQLGPRCWRLEVTEWEFVPQRDFEQVTGILASEGGDTWLVTDGGERYRLLGVPERLKEGERVQVVADEPLIVGGDLAWWIIHSPPPSERDVEISDPSNVDPSSLAGEQFVVDGVRLAYYVPQSPSVEPIVQPVWMFEGHDAADATHFVAHVQAVTEEYIQDAVVTVTPGP
ncbi:MAG: hypothetical protein U9R72_12770 [Chloroflexota bacterium]|nr:hypothetical protein [Chloroflexota bacterium]